MDNRRTGLRSKIWALDTELTLEGLNKLFELDYNEPIKYLHSNDYGDYSPEDKTLLHRWESNGEIHTFDLNDEDNSKIRYVIAFGHMEKQASESNAYFDEERRVLLPRAKRVHPYEAGVIFLEISNRLYSIVYGSNSAFDVKSILMGAGNGVRRKSEWGKIEVNPQQYKLDSDFYYWLFNKHKTKSIINTVYGDYEIRDVEGIGRLSDRQQHNTKGKGPKSTDELSNKTALGVNQSIYESDFNIFGPNIDLCVSLGEQCITDGSRTILSNGKEIFNINYLKPDFLMKLYTEIIPGLYQAYNIEKSQNRWTSIHSRQAKKEWAMEVIEELAQYHSILASEVLELTWFVKHP